MTMARMAAATGNITLNTVVSYFRCMKNMRMSAALSGVTTSATPTPIRPGQSSEAAA